VYIVEEATDVIGKEDITTQKSYSKLWLHKLHAKTMVQLFY